MKMKIIMEVLLESLIHMFSLSIIFGIVTWSKVKLYVQNSA